MTRYFVVGTYDRLVYWCRTNGRRTRDKNVIFIGREEHAYGFKLTEDDVIVDVARDDQKYLIDILERRRLLPSPVAHLYDEDGCVLSEILEA